MRRMVALLPVLIAFQAGAPPALAWTWPVDGPVLRPFELGDDPYAAGQHRGLDVGGEPGVAVRAPVSGVVSFAGTVPGGGRSLTLRTADGLSVTLVHLGAIGVARTARVEEGAVVGEIGPSGEAEHPVPYVHLGVRRTAEADGYLDPLAFLPRVAVKGPAPPQPAPVPVSAADQDTAAPAAATPHAPHASATQSRHGNRGRDAHATRRSGHREAAPGAPTPAGSAVTAEAAATARPVADSPSRAATRRPLPGTFEVPAPDAASAAATRALDRSRLRAGSWATPTRVVPLVVAVAASLAAVGIAAVRRRRAGCSSPAGAGGSSLVPEPAPACEPVGASSEAPARPHRTAAPRCASRGRPHRPPRRRAELAAAS